MKPWLIITNSYILSIIFLVVLLVVKHYTSYTISWYDFHNILTSLLHFKGGTKDGKKLFLNYKHSAMECPKQTEQSTFINMCWNWKWLWMIAMNMF